ncbi:MAG TPA: WYL domain-containing protein [Hyphomicrobiaceae bacterium]|nr:WYL domain-containing protein [Hyphomicrobiaceae bacterium]
MPEPPPPARLPTPGPPSSPRRRERRRRSHGQGDDLDRHSTDVLQRRSQRTVRSLSLAYVGPLRIVAVWCGLRGDFRTFRLDRIERLQVTGERFRPKRGKTLRDFLKRPKTVVRSALNPTGEERH